MSDGKCQKCSLCVCSSALILLILCSIPIIIEYTIYDNYNINTCYINNIDYPIDFPTFNDTSNWIECDCGIKCIAWTPCIKLYSNISSDVMIINDFYDKNDKCTFYNKNCPNGENIIYTRQEFIKAHELVNTYLNKNVTCYLDNPINYIFLNKIKNTSSFLGIIISLSIITLFIIIFCVNLNNCIMSKNLISNNKTDTDIKKKIIINNKYNSLVKY
jgi:hypothetical protein